MNNRRLRGTRDIIFPESDEWKKVIRAAARVLSDYDFSLILTPVIEEKSLFTRSIGEGSDIVIKEMYEFKDKKGREIVLRPEGTASVVRAYIENSLPEKSNLYYAGRMYRYEKPQKGRNREFYQVGAESYGDGTAYKDAEIIMLADGILKEAGLSSYSIRINMLNCNECGPGYINKLREYFNEKKDALCPECKNRLERAPVRIFDCKNEKCTAVIKDAPKISENLCNKCRGRIDKVKELLKAAEVEFVRDPDMVRGLDYYTGIVFEFITDKLGPQQNTVLAGGRYDALVKELGGKDIPAIGFALGMERVVEVMKEEKKESREPGPDVFIVYDAKYTDKAFSTAFKLRKEKISCALNYEGKSFKSQMREAGSKNAAYAFILGASEAEKGMVSVKDMKTGKQEEMDTAEFIKFIKSKS